MQCVWFLTRLDSATQPDPNADEVPEGIVQAEEFDVLDVRGACIGPNRLLKKMKSITKPVTAMAKYRRMPRPVIVYTVSPGSQANSILRCLVLSKVTE